MDNIYNCITILCVGNHQSKRIAFCQCKAPVVTILHLQLWPGSPDRPTTAFHFRLMDMAVGMFIHCQVSLQELSDVLELKRSPLQPKIVISFTSTAVHVLTFVNNLLMV